MIGRLARVTRLDLSGTMGLLTRFAASGVLNGVVYACVFAIASYQLGFSASEAAGAGYVAGLIVSFLLHRNFTFLANGNVYGELLRFLTAQALTMAAVVAVSHVASHILSWPTWLVILSGIATAPVLNFLLMYYWVFTSTPVHSLRTCQDGSPPRA